MFDGVLALGLTPAPREREHVRARERTFSLGCRLLLAACKRTNEKGSYMFPSTVVPDHPEYSNRQAVYLIITLVTI